MVNVDDSDEKGLDNVMNGNAGEGLMMGETSARDDAISSRRLGSDFRE